MRVDPAGAHLVGKSRVRPRVEAPPRVTLLTTGFQRPRVPVEGAADLLQKTSVRAHVMPQIPAGTKEDWRPGAVNVYPD